MSLYDQMLDGYDDVEASQGFSGEPLAAGWYAFRIERILDKKTNDNGTPTVRLQLQVVAGPKESIDLRAFVTQTLAASTKDKEGAQRTDTQFKEANRKIQGQVKGLLKALGVSTGSAVGADSEKVFNFYNVDSWTGREFVGRMNLRAAQGQYPASNQLAAFHPYSDDKHGIEWLRAQLAKAGTTPSGSSNTTTPATL